ncbi:TetR/AcrR family transcriptional regulator [Leclercia adecarboxylata]|uniref:TetR/AcrR family transcriptional regulator n=1 Tax=Leclercia adecarboxylata TaxID=83655 RepID=A0A9X3Y8L3_9ENTR|nr:TetR/AcrR family transcriptional regulator [Leclercia adecarboxylata]MDC6621565.1 TetR/AcrR family transcriptional regulator [Leclercia adecarboxylata]MDC6632557.1 TetR/AcrR family transcriptional regulator [Leclercia adecarboxylata]MDC6637933.1 TetR/AcrR family transcriptional regulator [Leclercia adecarboxylata]MDC6649752.1 TetR/AcrR family transcriptional regulator [Leclercia adecarboxylata]MDC6653171.1 TetR/AcrR family transcriptional regulator [Leclercia adecarboxylata]
MKTDADKPLRGRPVNEHAREERMTQILNGARTCFIQRGFHASSISEIGAAAGVSVANIYQYFPSKDVLITALIELDLQRHHNLISRFWSTDFSRKAIEELLAEIFLTPEGHAVAVLRAEIASEGARNTHVAELLRDSEAGLIDSVHSRIRAAQSSGQISPGLDPHAVTERLSLVFEGLMRLYLFSPDNGQKLIELYYRQFADTLQLKF